MTWHKLVSAAELPPGEVKEITWAEEDLLIWCSEDGSLGAISAYCAHTGNYMPNGLAPEHALPQMLHGNGLRCPFHGWCYDGSGRCTSIPPSQQIPSAVREGRPVIKSFQLREFEGWIQISSHPPG